MCLCCTLGSAGSRCTCCVLLCMQWLDNSVCACQHEAEVGTLWSYDLLLA